MIAHPAEAIPSSPIPLKIIPGLTHSPGRCCTTLLLTFPRVFVNHWRILPYRFAWGQPESGQHAFYWAMFYSTKSVYDLLHHHLVLSPLKKATWWLISNLFCDSFSRCALHVKTLISPSIACLPVSLTSACYSSFLVAGLKREGRV